MASLIRIQIFLILNFDYLLVLEPRHHRRLLMERYLHRFLILFYLGRGIDMVDEYLHLILLVLVILAGVV